MKHGMRMFKYGLMMLSLIWGMPLHAEKSYRVEAPSFLVEAISLKGKWLPLNLNPVRAPFEGTLVEVFKPYGSEVKEGDLLFKLSFEGLDLTIKEAELDYQRKKEVLDAYETFEQSVEYLEAKHAMLMAEQELQNREKYYQETKILTEMGGISKETLFQDKISYERALQAKKIATLRFQELKNRKSKVAYQQAALEVAQAHHRLQELLTKQNQLEVKAPISGVLFSPALILGQNQAPILSVGDRLENKQPLAVIASDDAYGISLELNEPQMAWVDKADRVTANIGGETLSLHLLSVEPLHLQNSETNHRYQVSFKGDRVPAMKPRLGAGVEIALLIPHEVKVKVPIGALTWEADQPRVKRFDSKTNSWMTEGVHIGLVNSEWAEVLSGVQQGDIIGLPDSVG